MSKLDDQLKELQRRKAKIEMYIAFKKRGAPVSDTYKDIASEVKDEINSFIDNKIALIESNEIEQPVDVFTDAEVKILKGLANRAAERAKEPTVKTPSKPKEKKPVAETQDVLSFALKYRSWGGKTVTVENAGLGKVVGMEAPNIIVKLEANAMTVKVPPENISL